MDTTSFGIGEVIGTAADMTNGVAAWFGTPGSIRIQSNLCEIHF